MAATKLNQLSNQDRKDFEKYTKYLVYKCIQIIIQSRLGMKKMTESKPFSSGTDWVIALSYSWSTALVVEYCLLCICLKNWIYYEVYFAITYRSVWWVNAHDWTDIYSFLEVSISILPLSWKHVILPHSICFLHDSFA